MHPLPGQTSTLPATGRLPKWITRLRVMPGGAWDDAVGRSHQCREGSSDRRASVAACDDLVCDVDHSALRSTRFALPLHRADVSQPRMSARTQRQRAGYHLTYRNRAADGEDRSVGKARSPATSLPTALSGMQQSRQMRKVTQATDSKPRRPGPQAPQATTFASGSPYRESKCTGESHQLLAIC